MARGTGLDLLEEIDLTCDAGCDPIALPQDALILLAAPVYGGRVAPTALERLARLRGQGQAAVAVVVYGNRDYEDALLEIRAGVQITDSKLCDEGIIEKFVNDTVVAVEIGGEPYYIVD